MRARRVSKPSPGYVESAIVVSNELLAVDLAARQESLSKGATNTDRHDSICIAAYEAAQLLLEIASSPAGLEHQARLLSAASKIMNQVNEIAPGLWSYGVGVMLERAAKTISTEQNNRHDYRR